MGRDCCQLVRILQILERIQLQVDCNLRGDCFARLSVGATGSGVGQRCKEGIQAALRRGHLTITGQSVILFLFGRLFG